VLVNLEFDVLAREPGDEGFVRSVERGFHRF
jgi:hypothetical protein